jgi:hypothetical protein
MSIPIMSLLIWLILLVLAVYVVRTLGPMALPPQGVTIALVVVVVLFVIALVQILGGFGGTVHIGMLRPFTAMLA